MLGILASGTVDLHPQDQNCLKENSFEVLESSLKLRRLVLESPSADCILMLVFGILRAREHS